MRIYDLAFTDGKRCRMIIPEPESEAKELENMRAMFGADRLASMTRIIAPPPDKIPWKRVHATLWHCGLFALSKMPDGQFRVFWPGGDVTGDKDLISATVRGNWAEGS